MDNITRNVKQHELNENDGAELEKLTVVDVNQSQESRVNELGYQFLCEPLWWLGIATMGVGEVANFSAYRGQEIFFLRFAVFYFFFRPSEF